MTDAAPLDKPDPRPAPYYEALGRACDYLLRCKDCRRLVPPGELVGGSHACGGCGSQRFNEITTLSIWEWVRIKTGLLDFPHRASFLAEFARGGRR